MEQYPIVEKLMELYGYNKFDFRYMYINKDGEAAYTDPHRALTYTDLYEHLDGKKTVSVYGRKWHTKFMTIDVDESNKEAVFLLINKMEEVGIPKDRIYVSMSGNKGYHLDVFFDVGLSMKFVENLFKYIWRDPEVKKIAVECFPLYHNAIKIPLGINLKTSRRCWYADRDTLEPYENDYEYILDIKPMSAGAFKEIVSECNKKAWVEDLAIAKENAKKPKENKNNVKLEGSIYQSKNEPVITMPGQRHQLMCRKSVYLRCVGADEETIYNELLKWVDRQDQSLIRSSRSEIEKDAAQIAHSAVNKYDVKVTDKPHKEKEQKPAELYITDGDMKQILKATTKMARRVAFLICVYCKKYGACILGYRKIEEIIGASDMAAYRAIKLLTELGIVSQKSHGGMTRTNGKPVLKANKYLFIGAEENDELTRVFFNFDDIERDFEKAYYGTIRKMCDDETVKQHFTGTEVRRIKDEN